MQAGAAALNRISGQQQTNDSDLARNRQKAKIREQARKELEQEQKIQQEVEKIKQVLNLSFLFDFLGPSPANPHN